MAGYLVLSNFVLDSRPCERNNNTYRYPDHSRNIGYAMTTSESAMRGPAIQQFKGASSIRSEDDSSGPAPVETAVRSFFPPTFLFQLKKLG